MLNQWRCSFWEQSVRFKRNPRFLPCVYSQEEFRVGWECTWWPLHPLSSIKSAISSQNPFFVILDLSFSHFVPITSTDGIRQGTRWCASPKFLRNVYSQEEFRVGWEWTWWTLTSLIFYQSNNFIPTSFFKILDQPFSRHVPITSTDGTTIKQGTMWCASFWI